MTMNKEKIKELFETSAREVLSTKFETLSEDKQFWVQYYYDNCRMIKYQMDLDMDEIMPRDVSWKKLMWYLIKEEDLRAWEHHDELQLITHEDGYGFVYGNSEGDDEYSEADEYSEDSEVLDAVNEEGPPWDDCDDFELCYRNSGL